MVDHLKLVPGLYVSRKDRFGTELVTTFDIRMTSPNDEPVMNTAEVHTIEHLGATFCAIIPNLRKKRFILVQWVAGRGFICFWREITILKIFCRWLKNYLNLFVIFREKFREHRRETAEIVWIWICRWQNIWPESIWRKLLKILRRSDWHIRHSCCLKKLLLSALTKIITIELGLKEPI